MNTVQIKIMDVEINKATTKTNKPYEFLEVSYKNQSFQDKPEVKKVMPFGNKEVFDTLRKAVKGDIFTITREKNDGGFWDWVSIQTGENLTVTEKEPQKATSTAKSTWETPEERATKQLYIIRQSCLSNAVNTIVKPDTEADVDRIKEVAQEYVDFVVSNTYDINEDIPY